MKKLFVFLCVAGLIAASASPLFAGGIDNKTNWSAEYIRTLNRNAATDSADIVAYNPAGVMKMEDGLFGNLSVQFIDKKYNNKVGGTDLESHEPSYLPGLFLLYKRDRLAGFFSFTIPGGGGYVDYSQGNYTTQYAAALLNQLFYIPAFGVAASNGLQRFEAESYYYGYTFGGAFAINDMFSVSLAARYIDAYREAKGFVIMNPGVATEMTHYADYEEDADGWGGIIGLNIAPTEELNIGMRYETRTDLDFDQKVNQDENTLNPALSNQLLPYLGVNNGASVSRNLPAIFALGISYKFFQKFRVETNLTYYLNNAAGWDDTVPTPRDPSDVDDGYDLGIALEYTFNNKLKGSLGYLYTDTGIDAKNMLPESPELDVQTIGAGAAYECIPGMILNFAIGNSFYKSDSFVSSIGSEIEYEKNNFFISLGIQYKFL
jgi:long-chain fatty acid transport protein